MRVQHVKNLLGEASRRKGWFLENVTSPKLTNLLLACTQYMTKSENMRAWPTAVKIDVSPTCNLRCTSCVHARPNGGDCLEKQHFHADQKMSVERCQHIIDEIRETSVAVSLYYQGDPLMHPDIDQMCRIARSAGLNVHLSTNFSFPWTDERIWRHAESGVTHLTVCVDGLSQRTYERTRVGGRIDWVLSNLGRICSYVKEKKLRYPKIEVQYLIFEHNKDEIKRALRVFRDLGVGHVVFKKGATFSFDKPFIINLQGPKENRWLPQCPWPYFSMVVKYNGDVIPCCWYRMEEQYTQTGVQRVLGNVFQSNVRDVWNSLAYRRLRRLVSYPATAAAEHGSEDSFCHGCRHIFRLAVTRC